ncbi:hypothetical protein [Caulobacter sp. FWC2]|uniref:hypothetical protein n=1 Tax=Caulobacter sp. FWC2 TaxID=69664 RepID=UPI000C1619A5|nr:hypothetical protein [Caulobacter sp. FWC2]PIB92145.1 hypothetical protein CSW62_11535 [Caulobacter sp. FWC2]
MRKILTVTAVTLLTLAGPALAADVFAPLAPKFETVSFAMDSIGADEVSEDVQDPAVVPAAQSAQQAETARKGFNYRKFGRFWRKGAFWQSGAGAFTGVAAAVATTAVVIDASDNSKSG